MFNPDDCDDEGPGYDPEEDRALEKEKPEPALNGDGDDDASFHFPELASSKKEDDDDWEIADVMMLSDRDRLADLIDAVRAHIGLWRSVGKERHNEVVKKIVCAEEWATRKGLMDPVDLEKSRAREITGDPEEEANAWQRELEAFLARNVVSYDEAKKLVRTSFPRLRGFLAWREHALEYLASDQHYAPFDMD